MSNVPFPEFASYRVVEQYSGGEGWSAAVENAAGERRVLKVFDEASLAEASLLASVAHPMVPRILDAGQLASGRGYILREFLPGDALHGRTRMDPPAAKDFAVQVLQILVHIHLRGVFHFDIKPANILRRQRAGVEEFALLDFGLAGRRAASSHGGTPLFAAPERRMGLEGDARSDLYSLGVVLMLFLRDDGAPRRGDLTSRDFAGAAAVARLPTELGSWVPRLLAERPEDRFPDAGEALEALAGPTGRPSTTTLEPDPVAAYGERITAAVRDLGKGRDLVLTGADARTRGALAFHAASLMTGPQTCTLEPDERSVRIRRGGGEVRELPLTGLSARDLEAHLSAALGLDGESGKACAAHLVRQGVETIPTVGEFLKDAVARGEIVPAGPRWVWPAAMSGRLAQPVATTLPTCADAVREAATRGALELALRGYRAALPRFDAGEDRRWRAALAEGLLAGGEPARCLPFVTDLPVHHARALLDLGKVDVAWQRLQSVAGEPTDDLCVEEADRQRLLATLEHLRGDSTAALLRLDALAATPPVRIVRSLILQRRGEIGAALEEVEAALDAIDEEATPFLCAAAWTSRADVLRSLGRPEDARRDYEAAHRLLSRLGHVRHSATAATNLGVIAKDLGEFDVAMRYQRQARTLFDLVGDRAGWALAQANYGILHAVMGDAVSAREKLGPALRALRELGLASTRAQVVLRWCEAHRDAGNAAAARAALGELGTLESPELLRQAETLLQEIQAVAETSVITRDQPMRQPDSEPVPREVFRTYLAVNRRLAAEADLERAMQYLLEAAVTLTGGRAGWLLVEHADGIRREVRTGETNAPARAFSRSMVNQALQEMRTYTAEEALVDPQFAEMRSVRNLEHRSAICSPFQSAGGHRGALYVEHGGRAGVFGLAEQEHLEILADQAAIAVDRMRREERRDRELQQSQRDLRSARRGTPRTDQMLGKSPVIEALRSELARVAPSDLSVLIRGETGSGKELAARAVHRQSERHRGPFVAENCSAIPEDLIESEFFGHCKGAFTGADQDKVGLLQAASGGTLFLDEVGDMPPSLQVKLLRALQERSVRPVGSAEVFEIDIRLVTATHRDLRAMIAEGAFREDLYYRIAAVEILVPPLRERGKDVGLLCDAILAQMNADAGRSVTVSDDVRRTLAEYSWPGNVRELHHVLSRAFLLCEGDEITRLDLATKSENPEEMEWPAISLREAEHRTIRAALRVTGGDKTKAARLLGISRTAIYEKLRRMSEARGASDA